MDRLRRSEELEVLAEPVAVSSPTFEVFFLEEHRRLQQALFGLSGSQGEAEEIMQEAFLKLWERWERVRGLDDPVGYLYRTAMNIWRSRYRRALRAIRHRVHAPTRDVIDQTDERIVVGRALDSLTKKQRAAIILTEFVGYTSVGAAAILGVAPSTVRNLAHQARTKLKLALEESDEGRA